jgi:hypothetical protein
MKRPLPGVWRSGPVQQSHTIVGSGIDRRPHLTKIKAKPLALWHPCAYILGKSD